MATYTTIFVATDDELTRFFPGWRLPLANPVGIEVIDPFTNEKRVVDSWDPGPTSQLNSAASIGENHGRASLPAVVSGDTDYQAYLENIVPPLLNTFPHVGMKNITFWELGALAEAMLGKQLPAARFLEPREDEGFIGAAPAELVPALAAITDEEVEETAQKWGKVLPEHDSDLDSNVWCLIRLRALGREALSRGANMFSHFDA